MQSPFTSSTGAATPPPFQQQNAFGARPELEAQDAARFAGVRYEVRKKVLKLIGGAYFVEDADGRLLLYADQKGFTLKADIRLYDSEAKTREILVIQARKMMAVAPIYDVTDARNGQRIGALRRDGISSHFSRDRWEFLDAQDQPIGIVEEESLWMGLLRRWVEFAALLLPQNYEARVGERQVGAFKQNRSPFLTKLSVDFSSDTDQLLDKRLGVAAAILLCAIEGKQHGA